MIGHLFIPAIDSNANRAASVSRKSVTQLLKEEMGFKGITFTDALEMKGIANAFPDGASSVESLIAGNDMLCLPGDVEKTISKVKGAIAEGVLSWSQIDEHVRKLLLAKYQTGLAKWKPVSIEGLAIRLNEKTDALKKEIAEKAITLAKLDDKTAFPLPAGRTAAGIQQTIEGLDNPTQSFGNYALLEIGKNRNTVFAAAIRKNYNADVFMFDNSKSSAAADSLLEQLKGYDKIIIALHELPRFPANNFGISNEVVRLVNTINASTPSALFIFGNPYATKSFCDVKNIMVCYEDDAIVQEKSRIQSALNDTMRELGNTKSALEAREKEVKEMNSKISELEKLVPPAPKVVKKVTVKTEEKPVEISATETNKVRVEAGGTF
jgi:hypothetical protein